MSKQTDKIKKLKAEIKAQAKVTGALWKAADKTARAAEKADQKLWDLEMKLSDLQGDESAVGEENFL